MDSVSIMIKKLLGETSQTIYIIRREKLSNLINHPNPVKYSGVYWLFDGDEIVYIGFSSNIVKRLKAHSSKKWTKAKTMVIDETKIARGVESTLLLNFDTRYNSPKNRIAFRKRLVEGEPVAVHSYTKFKNFINRVNEWYKLYRDYDRDELMKFGSGVVEVFDKKEIYSRYVDVTYEEYEENFKLRLAGEKHDMYMI